MPRAGVAGRLLRHLALSLVLLVGVVEIASGAVDTRGWPAQGAVALATGVTVYVLMLRWGVWHWLAGLASAPALLHPLTQARTPDLLLGASFVLLVSLAALAVTWHSSISLVAWWLAGALLGVSTAVVPTAWWVVLAFAGSERPALAPIVLLLCCAALGSAAALGAGRARCSGMRRVCALTSVVPALALLGAAGVAAPSWPGWLLAVALWPAAGALGLTGLLRGRRGRATRRPQSDAVDRAALETFRLRYADPHLAEVVIVIAAYNEAPGLPEVLDQLPSTVCGMDADVLVVDDGSTDGTADEIEAQGHAYVVVSEVNRGQGAALRLGYRIAREHGASYVITTDADGQYDPADFPTVLGPVLEGSADFVTGSRRLGGQETRDRVRRLGVHVFAWAVSVLTGHWATDTSFGLRAMRAEVTESVTLNQPQYQSSELLIGALSHGWRVREVPGRMRVRAAGASKKGGNLVYGTRYARVVLGTWWREGCPAPAAERAPALAGRSLASTWSDPG